VSKRRLEDVDFGGSGGGDDDDDDNNYFHNFSVSRRLRIPAP
jgi:hypothetical protein